MQWLLPHHTAIVLKMHQEDYRQFMASYKLQSLHPRRYYWSIYLLIGIQKTCGNNILKPALLKSHWTNEADQGTDAIFLMLSVSWSSSIGFQEQIFKKSSLFFFSTHTQIGNQWTVMPWTALIWIAGLKWCSVFFTYEAKITPKIKDAVDSRGDEHLPSLFYGDLNILTYICPLFFNFNGCFGC